MPSTNPKMKYLQNVKINALSVETWFQFNAILDLVQSELNKLVLIDWPRGWPHAFMPQSFQVLLKN